MFKIALKCYRKDVPYVGKIANADADKLLHNEKICRGWIVDEDSHKFFHIIKSPTNYPNFSIFYADNEEMVLKMTMT